MARLTFPSDRLVYKASTYAGSAFASASGSTATVYSDAGGTTLADVQNFDGSANATATFTVDSTSRLPLFLGPANGADTLYVKIDAGPVTAIYAVTAGDISAAVGTEVTNRTAADAAHVAASNPHNVTPQLIGAPNVVVHGSTAGTARPAGATFVHWIGSVAPTNVTGNDEWTDTTNKLLKRWNGASFDALGSAAYMGIGVGARRARRRTVVFGTSIENQNFNGGLGTTNSKGPVAWANVLLGHRLNLIYNAGVSGNTSTQMLARIQADVLNQAPDLVIVGCGAPNDIGNSVSVATSIANHKAIYDQIAATGAQVVVCTPPPYGSFSGQGSTVDNSTSRTFLANLRLWQITYARDNGFILADYYPALVVTDGTGTYAQNMSVDGVHPGPQGAIRMARVLANALSPHVGDVSGLWLPASNADPTNLIANGLMVGTTGTLSAGGGTGNAPTSWTIFNNGGTTAYTASKVARTDGIQGEWAQIVATTGNADTLKFQQSFTGGSWVVGDTVLVAVEFQVDQDWVGGTDLNLTVNFQGSGGFQVADLFRSGSEVGVGQPPAPGGVLLAYGVIPASTTSVQVQVQTKVTTGTFRLGRVGAKNLTALGLAA